MQSVEKPNVLFLMAWIKSHIAPTFYVAQLLSGRYNIYYAVPDDVLKNLVTCAGFNTVDITAVRFAYGLEGQNESSTSNWLAKCIKVLRDVLSNVLYRKRKSEILNTIEALHPEYIFIDVFSSTDFLLLYGHMDRNQICFISPMLSINGNLRNGKKVSNLLRRMVSLLQIKSIFLKKDIPKEHRPLKTKFSFLFDNIPEILLAPRELDDRSIFNTNKHYLGLCLDPDTVPYAGFSPPESKDFVHAMSKAPKTIYCSFGSYSTNPSEQREIFYFIVALVEAISAGETLMVICAVGQIVKDALDEAKVSSPNFWFFTRAPQLQVLRKADLFITHGGFNSIKEAIYCQVPMLVYPLDLDYDQPDNAKTVCDLGLGLRGDLRNDEPGEIREKVLRIVNDHSYKKNIKQFSEKLNEKYTREYVIMELKASLPFF